MSVASYSRIWRFNKLRLHFMDPERLSALTLRLDHLCVKVAVIVYFAQLGLAFRLRLSQVKDHLCAHLSSGFEWAV